WTEFYYFVLALGLLATTSKRGERKDKILLWLSGGWFIWNLLAISFVTSKVPNFIYQSFLLSLFFVVYTLVILLKSQLSALTHIRDYFTRVPRWFVPSLLVISVLVTGYEVVRFTQQFHVQRTQSY